MKDNMFAREIQITGEAKFKIIFEDKFEIEYQFAAHAEKCPAFAVPVTFMAAANTCPFCGKRIRYIQ